MPSTHPLRIVTALVSGLLLTAAFPKVGVAWLAWVALVPLLVAIRDLPGWQAFWLGTLAGIVHFMTLVYWVVPTMQVYGHLPFYLSIPVLFLFATVLALFMGLFAALCAPAILESSARVFWVPACWVAVEYLRSTLFTGFPWALLGHAQYQSLVLIQCADLFGVYGVSYLAAMANTALFCLFRWAAETEKPTFRRKEAAALVLAAVVFAGNGVYGKVRMAHVDRRIAVAPTEPVAVVQGNIDQAVKWDAAFQAATVDKYLRLSKMVAAYNPGLVVWPETAMPFYFPADRDLTRQVLDGVREAQGHFLVGSNTVEHENGTAAYFNSAYLLTPGGHVSGRYDKVHLVPFGEYVPFKRWLPFIGKMVEHVGDFTPGRRGNVLAWKDGNLGVLICYEGIFPGLSRQMVRNGATLLVNITNDAWYGRSSAPYQLFSMAVFRAVENRRSLVRAANTGISGFFDPVGRIMAQTLLLEDAVGVQNVPLLQISTVYSRVGDLPAMACLLVAVAGRFRRGKTQKG